MSASDGIPKASMAARSMARISAEPTSLIAPPSPSSTTAAAAKPPSCVSVTSARRDAEPRRRVRGDPGEDERRRALAAHHLDVGEADPAGAPSAFDAASFAANRAA